MDVNQIIYVTNKAPLNTFSFRFDFLLKFFIREGESIVYIPVSMIDCQWFGTETNFFNGLIIRFDYD